MVHSDPNSLPTPRPAETQWKEVLLEMVCWYEVMKALNIGGRSTCTCSIEHNDATSSCLDRSKNLCIHRDHWYVSSHFLLASTEGKSVLGPINSIIRRVFVVIERKHLLQYVIEVLVCRNGDYAIKLIDIHDRFTIAEDL